MSLFAILVGFAAWTFAGLAFWITMTGIIGRRFAARPRHAKAESLN